MTTKLTKKMTARVGKQYFLTKREDMRGRCSQQGCNVSWEGVDGYMKCEGCDFNGCKIRQAHLERETKNAQIEADRLIMRAKQIGVQNKHHRHVKREASGDNEVVLSESPIDFPYVPTEAEIMIEKQCPPIMTFRIVP